MLHRYLPKVRAFLVWVMKGRRPFDTDADTDQALADYIEVLCYGERKAFWYAEDVFFGFLAFFLGRDWPGSTSGDSTRSGRCCGRLGDEARSGVAW